LNMINPIPNGVAIRECIWDFVSTVFILCAC
jgi:hypothetical protein